MGVAEAGGWPTLVGRCHRNYLESHWRHARLAPGGRRRDWPGATALASAIPSVVTNLLFVHDPTTVSSATIDEASRFFDRSTSWRLIVPAEGAPVVPRLTTRLTISPSRSVPGMVLDPIPPAPDPPTDLAVREVSDPAALRDYRRAGGLGFGIPRWILRVAMPRCPRRTPTEDDGIRLFVGYRGGEAVATSALTVSDGVAGVGFVATVPRARRRGFGAALTWAAIDAGRADGARVGFLQASTMGRPVYEAMGFREVTEYHQWVVPRAAGTGVWGIIRMMRLGLTRWSQCAPR